MHDIKLKYISSYTLFSLMLDWIKLKSKYV